MISLAMGWLAIVIMLQYHVTAVDIANIECTHFIFHGYMHLYMQYNI